MVLVYAGVAVSDVGLWTLALVLLLHGADHAATDGVIAALISGSTPSDVRASGLAALNTATSLTRLARVILVGVIWSWRGPGTVVTLALIAAAMTAIVSAFALKGVAGKPIETGSV